MVVGRGRAGESGDVGVAAGFARSRVETDLAVAVEADGVDDEGDEEEDAGVALA